MKASLSLAIILTAALSGACTAYQPEESYPESRLVFETKSFIEEAERISGTAPQVDTFSLYVEGGEGVVYEGTYGERPGEIIVPQGVCRFRILSGKYSGPVFDSPLWGDEQVIQVVGEEYITVNLTCRQMTCGVRIIYSEEFRTCYPDAFVRVTCRDTVSMTAESSDYGVENTGFIHFLPGRLTVDLLENSSAVPELLTGRDCAAADMFTVRVDITPSSGGSHVKVEVSVDTTASYFEQTYLYGSERSGLTPFDALRPGDIPSHSGDTLWVAGYVTGCYVNKKFISGADSLAVSTNIALSDTPFHTESSWTAFPECGPSYTLSGTGSASENSVTVPVYVYSGTCRSLNLKDNPSVLGSRVAVRGIIGTLYDLPAVKKGMAYVYL